jgi:hypothetical protein
MTGPEDSYPTYESRGPEYFAAHWACIHGNRPMGTPPDPGVPDGRTPPPGVPAVRDLVVAPGPVG